MAGIKTRIVSKKADRIVFVLENTTPAFANALRRIMISEIPTLSIRWVEMHENSSVLFDEIISHRLGLIPLRFDPAKLNLPDECRCEGKGCSLCQAVFAIEKTGPCMVYSGDMKSSNRAVSATDPGFPILELLPKQRLKLEAVAGLGFGKDHIKHQAAIASYQYYPEVEMHGSASARHEKACPKHVLKVTGGKAKIKDPAECDLCMSCHEVDGSVKIKALPDKFIFRAESVSGLDIQYIITKAAQTLRQKAEDFKKQVVKI